MMNRSWISIHIWTVTDVLSGHQIGFNSSYRALQDLLQVHMYTHNRHAYCICIYRCTRTLAPDLWFKSTITIIIIHFYALQALKLRKLTFNEIIINGMRICRHTSNVNLIFWNYNGSRLMLLSMTVYIMLLMHASSCQCSNIAGSLSCLAHLPMLLLLELTMTSLAGSQTLCQDGGC